MGSMGSDATSIHRWTCGCVVDHPGHRGTAHSLHRAWMLGASAAQHRVQGHEYEHVMRRCRECRPAHTRVRADECALHLQDVRDTGPRMTTIIGPHTRRFSCRVRLCVQPRRHARSTRNPSVIPCARVTHRECMAVNWSAEADGARDRPETQAGVGARSLRARGFSPSRDRLATAPCRRRPSPRRASPAPSIVSSCACPPEHAIPLPSPDEHVVCRRLCSRNSASYGMQ